MGPFAEHLLIFCTTLLFPPVAITVLLCVLLATFGKSLGLRKIYVESLISIFEWGARQIKSSEQIKRKESIFHLAGPDSDVEDNETDGELSSDGGLRRRHGSGASLSSLASVCSNKRIRRNSSSLGIIQRETQIHLDDDEEDLVDDEVYVNSRGWAVIGDSLDFAKAGMEAIIEDEVTSRFEAEQLATWNMLTRTSIRFYHWKLTALYFIGFLFRYVVMLPLRFTLFALGLLFLIVSTAVIGLVPNGAMKRKLNHHCMLISYRILSRCLTAVVSFHDTHNKAKSGGICVANHTSPIDAMILSIDNVYALIGQSHSGLLGLIQRALSRASSHIWFERSEAKDRSTVTNTLRDHCNDPHKLPILIFPEGTCINNTSVMMFKKGSFEVGTTIYPIAMKYDSRFGDPFWNSSEQSWLEYIMRMMTSWAIICNVWYLPSMTKQDDEDAIEFANRVKKAIANKGGLVDLEWDGMLKRTRVPKKLVAKQQEKYAHRLSRYTSTSQAVNKDGVEEDDEYLSFLSPSVSGYNSLEELPEDAIVTDEEDEGQETEVQEDEAIEIKSDNFSDLGIENTPPVRSNPLSPVKS